MFRVIRVILHGLFQLLVRRHLQEATGYKVRWVSVCGSDYTIMVIVNYAVCPPAPAAVQHVKHLSIPTCQTTENQTVRMFLIGWSVVRTVRQCHWLWIHWLPSCVLMVVLITAAQGQYRTNHTHTHTVLWCPCPLFCIFSFINQIWCQCKNPAKN